jgi:hypothetical protein
MNIPRQAVAMNQRTRDLVTERLDLAPARFEKLAHRQDIRQNHLVGGLQRDGSNVGDRDGAFDRGRLTPARLAIIAEFPGPTPVSQ